MCACSANALSAIGSGSAGMSNRAESATAIADAESSAPVAQMTACHAITNLERRQGDAEPVNKPMDTPGLVLSDDSCESVYGLRHGGNGKPPFELQPGY